ncbi:MAG: DUF4093 domain-containing protein [Clostridiales bacterium]|jgi:ribonuclease M5|nr:DUF4093 domain-containing protein [Clostridiales bacterium]MCI2161213.1 DUF4093 domain-containing protein [Oscillospiraceae bacterium]MCI1960515.1 DUF4093 domain-containing protein [Clostridiales bacterium]MCI2021002.1 DUF4093 domain-containing protein [Clostridiales bacterium]MCI2025385.1 DUF4093 domain-containing protein [Clostridiales bacterium]
MIHINEAVVVEGKYDQIKLSSIIDALILQTHGFRIFQDREQLDLLRHLAETRGLLILTDSDSAGFQIRNFLVGAIGSEHIKHAYIPDVFGKERRKEKPGKEGKLGVEGVQKEVILEALRRSGAIDEQSKTLKTPENQITKQDLFFLGLSGCDQSAEKRKQLLNYLQLPEHLSTNALPKVLNAFFTKSEFEQICARIF